MSLGLVLSLGWVNRDGRVIILARGLHTFAQSYAAVLLALYLDELGFSLAQVGAFLSAGVAGSALFAFVAGLVADRVGRRRLFIVFSMMSAVAALGLVFVDAFLPLVAFAFLGSLTGGGGTGVTGPLEPLDQASLPDAAPAHRRTDLFAIYRIVSTAGAAMGSLAAGLPTLIENGFDLSALAAYRVMFVGFALLLSSVGLLYALLSPAVEVRSEKRGWVNPLRLPSRRIIFTLTGLFSVDRFAGSLIVQSLVAYWFSTRFGLEPGELAVVFFLSHILSAISLWLAAKLANRIGLLNTMVFTHIPSSVFLIAAAFAPTAWSAVLFWQLRSFLGQMDVPTRDSYTMAVVGPTERVAMASVQIAGRSVASIAGPSVATVLWSAIAASAPLIGCGVLKITYDIALYLMFRNVRPPEEAKKSEGQVVVRKTYS